MFALSVCVFVAISHAAKAQNFLEKVAITGTAYVQSATSNDNGTKTTVGSPTKISITTAYILKQLAIDEGTTFPSNAKLDWNGSGFEVDQGTNEIQDVSDILTVSSSGQNTITWGTSSDSGNTAFSQSAYQIYAVAYSGSASGLSFTVTGMSLSKSSGSTPSAKSGNFTETESFTFSNGVGEGQTAAGPMVITGFTATASGSATENDGQGTD